MSWKIAGVGNTPEQRDVTLVSRYGRILLMSCKRFVDEIVMGDACFVGGALTLPLPDVSLG